MAARSSKLPIITVFGSLNMDMTTVTKRVPEGGETIMAESFSTGCGGKGANQAVAAARLSKFGSGGRFVNVQMVGGVGNDDFGKALIRNLSADDVDVRQVREVQEVATGTATILVEKETGENRIMVAAGANAHVVSKLGYGGRYGNVLLCQLECPLESVLSHMKAARSQGTSVVLNPSPAVPLSDDFFSNTDYLVVNTSEASLLSDMELKHPYTSSSLQSIAQKFIDKGVRVVVITLGGDGCYYRDQQSCEGKVETEKVKVVDTTAAGDTFVGAFAVCVALSSAENLAMDFSILKTAIEFGTAAAAQTVQKPGAQDSIPLLSVLGDDWLKRIRKAP